MEKGLAVSYSHASLGHEIQPVKLSGRYEIEPNAAQYF